MILDLISKYDDLIISYNITKFQVVGSSYNLICKMDLLDNSRLFIRDYLFLNGARKYSFHWQNNIGECILRWDNAPHHQEIATFPYHLHVGKEENIEESHPMKLEMVLEYIRKQIL